MTGGDLLTSTNTFLAAYRKAMEAGHDHDTAVFLGDRAIVRSHGESSITNTAPILRQNGTAKLCTSLYGVFNHFLQRNYEMAWKAKDAIHGMTEGNLTDAKKFSPYILFGMFSYY